MVMKSELLNSVSLYGETSTSFLTLYDGFSYFKTNEGTLAYVSTTTAWVGAGDPLIVQGSPIEFLKQFQAAAKKMRKQAILLPASQGLALEARKEGFYAIQIGSEPWLSFESIPPKVHQQARKLLAKSAVVEAFDPLKISSQERSGLDLITQDWLDHRKTAPLSFLNKIEPWSFVTHKRYFRVIFHGAQVGYLAAVPIPAKKSWYLVDLIRAPDAPIGTTELLIIEATKQLKAQGAEQVTLGMSPFAPIEGDEKKLGLSAYWWFEKFYDRLNFLYGFKSLFQYKEKYNPVSWKPQFVIALDKKITVSMLWGIFRAIYPQGLLPVLASLVAKIPDKLSIRKFYSSLLSPRIVPRSPPQGLLEIIQNSKATLILIMANVLFFFTSTDSNFRLRPMMAEGFAFSGHHFFDQDLTFHGAVDLTMASFLHWNTFHLFFNVMTFLFLVTFLEFVAGSAIVAITYFTGVILANPFTLVILYPVIRYVFPHSFQSFFEERDVGSSLGIYSCIGMLACFTKYEMKIMSAFSVGVVGYAAITGSFLSLNHITAILIGYMMGKKYVATI